MALQTAIIAILLIGISIRFRKELYTILTSAFVKGVAVIWFLGSMTSGYMWNRIRKPAAYGMRRIAPDKTQIEYFSASLQQQYGMESRIILALGTLSFI